MRSQWWRQRIWVRIKPVLHWATRWQRILAAMLFVVGLPGTRDDLLAWIKIVKKFAKQYVPRITDTQLWTPVMEWITASWWPYVFIPLSLVVFFFGDKLLRGGQRIANRATFFMAEALDKELFISAGDAYNLVRLSEWAKARRRRSNKPKSIQEMFGGLTLTHDPREQVKNEMFHRWCNMVLDQFALEESESVREVDGRKEYAEAKLREWIKERYVSDIIHEFGDP